MSVVRVGVVDESSLLMQTTDVEVRRNLITLELHRLADYIVIYYRFDLIIIIIIQLSRNNIVK